MRQIEMFSGDKASDPHIGEGLRRPSLDPPLTTAIKPLVSPLIVPDVAISFQSVRQRYIVHLLQCIFHASLKENSPKEYFPP